MSLVLYINSLTSYKRIKHLEIISIGVDFRKSSNYKSGTKIEPLDGPYLFFLLDDSCLFTKH